MRHFVEMGESVIMGELHCDGRDSNGKGQLRFEGGIYDVMDVKGTTLK